MLVFRKIWSALFSWNTRFEIFTFDLLPAKFIAKDFKASINHTAHMRNIKRLAMEVLKVKQNLSNTMVKNIFLKRASIYKIRSDIGFSRINENAINSWRYKFMKVFFIEFMKHILLLKLQRLKTTGNLILKSENGNLMTKAVAFVSRNSQFGES